MDYSRERNSEELLEEWVDNLSNSMIVEDPEPHSARESSIDFGSFSFLPSATNTASVLAELGHGAAESWVGHAFESHSDKRASGDFDLDGIVFSDTKSSDELENIDNLHGWAGHTYLAGNRVRPPFADLVPHSGSQKDTSAVPPQERIQSGYVPEVSSANGQKRKLGSSPSSGALRCGYEGCQYTCRTNSELHHHQRCHTSYYERLHLCSQCGKRFLYHKDLIRHRTTHEDRAYFCDVPACVYGKKGFRRHDHLTRHKRTKHGVRTALEEAAIYSPDRPQGHRDKRKQVASAIEDDPLHESRSTGTDKDALFSDSTSHSATSSPHIGSDERPDDGCFDISSPDLCDCLPETCHAEACPPEDPPCDPAVAQRIAKIYELLNLAKKDGVDDRAASVAVGSSTGTDRAGRGGKKSKTTRKRRKPSDNEDNEGGGSPPDFGDPPTKTQKVERLFACPVAKFNYLACDRWCRGYKRFCDMKQHLRRDHLDESGHRFEGRAGTTKTYEEMDQDLELAGDTNGADKWRTLYRSLYPQVSECPNPFLDVNALSLLQENVQLWAANAELMDRFRVLAQQYEMQQQELDEYRRGSHHSTALHETTEVPQLSNQQLPHYLYNLQQVGPYQYPEVHSPSDEGYGTGSSGIASGPPPALSPGTALLLDRSSSTEVQDHAGSSKGKSASAWVSGGCFMDFGDGNSHPDPER